MILQHCASKCEWTSFSGYIQVHLHLLLKCVHYLLCPVQCSMHRLHLFEQIHASPVCFRSMFLNPWYWLLRHPSRTATVICVCTGPSLLEGINYNLLSSESQSSPQQWRSTANSNFEHTTEQEIIQRTTVKINQTWFHSLSKLVTMAPQIHPKHEFPGKFWREYPKPLVSHRKCQLTNIQSILYIDRWLMHKIGIVNLSQPGMLEISGIGFFIRWRTCQGYLTQNGKGSWNYP